MYLEARPSSGETPYPITATGNNMKQAWHRDGTEVTYWVRGTDGSGIIGIEAGANPGMFPMSKPSGIAADYVPNPALLVLAHYSRSAAPWNDALAGSMTIRKASREMGAGVIIRGYWNTDPAAGEDDGQCGQSVACTYPSGSYPHIGNGQVLWLEDPPRWGNRSVSETWTTNFSDAVSDPEDYEYLPSILLHEFGHTIGLGESKKSDAIMNGAVRKIGACLPGVQCGLSVNDKHGARAIYLPYGSILLPVPAP